MGYHTLLIETTNGRGRMRRLLAIGTGLALAGAVAAQTVPDAQVPETGLKLPSNVELFGKADPNVRKATAIVNGEIITATDVDQRLALIVTANGGQIPDEERERLRLQVLRNLIDETLQIQEAKANEVVISQGEINQSYDRVAGNFKRTPADLAVYLKQQGSSDRSIKRQIEGELAWGRLLRRKVEPLVSVGDEEVQSIIDRLNAAKGTKEYRLSEIFISATPETAAEASANATKIIAQLREGGSFQAYARQFSEATTAAVGGDLGWIRPAVLPVELAAAVQQMQVGTVAGPIPIPGGVSILALTDERQVLTADPRDAVLSLRQVSIKFAPGLSREQATARAASFGTAIKGIAGCGAVDKVAAQIGAEVVDNDAVRIRDLPPQLQELMINLQIGQATPPFGSPEEGVRTLVLCGRDDVRAAAGPSAEQIRGQMEEQKVNRRARLYLRDLRRDAIVEYR